MSFVTLQEADTKQIEDQLFLYEVLKFRWANADTINIKYKHAQTELPTFEQHVQHINSDKYKKIYIVIIGNVRIGMVYIDKQDINGTFVVPKFLKQALKVCKKVERINEKPLSAMIHTELFRKHPEITLHYATVNPNNKHSLNSLLENGYEIVEIVLAMKTKGGEGAQGKWKVV